MMVNWSVIVYVIILVNVIHKSQQAVQRGACAHRPEQHKRWHGAAAGLQRAGGLAVGDCAVVD